MNAAQVICDQVRHRASDQGDQNGSKPTVWSPEEVSTITNRVGRLLRRKDLTVRMLVVRGGLSWFSSRVAVTALLCESSILSRPSWLRRGAHFSCCSDWNICFTVNVYV